MHTRIELSIDERIFLFGMFLLLILNYGLQIRTIGPVPSGEVLLLIGFSTVAVFRYRNPVPLLSWQIFPAFVVQFLALVHLSTDFREHGVWALRDASHAIEISAMLIGALTPVRVMTWVGSHYAFVPASVIAYALLYLVREDLDRILPSVISQSGSEANFVQFVSTPTLIVACAFTTLSILRKPSVIQAVAIFAAPVFLAIVLFQARTTYLQLAACLLWSVFVVRRNNSLLYISIIAALLLLALLPLTGLQIPGRLGVDFDLAVAFRHILAIGGVASEGFDAAAEGVGQRTDWWLQIWDRSSDSILAQLFGLGYGLPLIDFEVSNGVIVREPHNSYVSTFARLGFFGLIAVLSLHVIILHSCASVLHGLARVKGSYIDVRYLNVFTTFSGYLLICIIVFSFGEDGFEKPFFAVPFYFVGGCLIALRRCVNQANGFRNMSTGR